MRVLELQSAEWCWGLVRKWMPICWYYKWRRWVSVFPSVHICCITGTSAISIIIMGINLYYLFGLLLLLEQSYFVTRDKMPALTWAIFGDLDPEFEHWPDNFFTFYFVTSYKLSQLSKTPPSHQCSKPSMFKMWSIFNTQHSCSITI